MTQAAQPKNLPTILASLRQDGRNGELILEQNDGLRRLYLIGGELVYLQSDVAGEQFGNYLLRQGVLDFPVLNKLLANDERFRLGEKVVQWGLMSVQERDSHLQLLQEQVMVNALEHQIVQLTWNPGPVGVKLSEDLQLKLDHRHFIWTTFLEAHLRQESFDLLQAQGAWRWEGIPGLLEAVSDLPLDPATAYALSFLGSEPISFQTFHSLSELPEATAARITLSLWAVGALTLVQGEQPSLALGPEPMAPAAPSTPPPMPSFPPPPPAPLPLLQPPPVPAQAAPPKLELGLDVPPLSTQPEFLETEPAVEGVLAPEAAPDPFPLVASPDRSRGLYRKAKNLQLQERTGEAIRCLEQSVQLDPSSNSAFEVWLLLGRLRMTNPAWSTRAINALQVAAKIRPHAPEPWISMGEVYFRKSFRANAAACFHRALELDPSVPIPPEVDLRDLEPATVPEPVAPASLFSRFRSILGGSDKK